MSEALLQDCQRKIKRPHYLSLTILNAMLKHPDTLATVEAHLS